MLISFITFVDSPDYRGQIGRLLKEIARLEYRKDMIEVAAYLKEVNASRPYKVAGPPLIRILPADQHRPTAANQLLKEVHGHISIVIDPNIRFRPDMIKRIEKEMWRDCAFVGKGYYSVSKSHEWPHDCLCLKTSAVVGSMLAGKRIVGRLGRLNRQEIVRILYRWDELSFNNKMRLIGGWICGK